tara:strand:+ start:130 stop:453 length:324 start_codon:yes stop_codon:yes gene_type:complete
MNKELVEVFVLECKQEQECRKKWNTNHINFNDYFLYSGEVEEEVAIDKRVVSFTKLKSLNTDCEITAFWFENPNYTCEEVSFIFECPIHTVKSKLNTYFDNKKVYNG